MNFEPAPQRLRTIRELLQEAHFAARDLREDVPSGRVGDLADQIHRVRLLAEDLGTLVGESVSHA